jgi:uncharacterized protein YbjT (DUF2867 family)
MQHPKLEQLVVDFDNLANYREQLKANDIYCCLGTTIKQAGSKENFYKVDYTYVMELAKMAAANQATQFLLVTALGADAHSRIFYSKVKGQIEAAVQALPFRAIHIFQPSLLMGNRKEKRAGESLAQIIMPKLNFLLVGGLRKYRPVQAEDVAQAMVMAAQQELLGLHVHPSDKIIQYTQEVKL